METGLPANRSTVLSALQLAKLFALFSAGIQKKIIIS